MCETQLNPGGAGYQLVITEAGVTHIESFDALRDLLAREHQLLHAWRALGWREHVTPPAPGSKPPTR